MKYLKLIKLLYIADREALSRWNRPVTTDRFVSMKEGPVVSNIYDLIRSEPAPNDQSIWHKHIQTVADWDVTLVSSPVLDELSDAEEALLAEVFKTHGQKNRWTIVEETHKFPEWKNPGTSSIPITYLEVLKAVHKDRSEVSAALEELKSMNAARAVLRPL